MSPRGKRLASAGDDGEVRVWDPTTRKVVTLIGHDRARVNQQFGLIRSLAWSPDLHLPVAIAALTLFILVSLGLITIGFALSRWLPLSCVLLFLGGVAIMASASLMLSLAQLSTTDAMRGRVMSVYNLAFRAGIPLGSLIIGKLIPTIGVTRAVAGAGLALVAVSLYFLLASQEATFRRPAAQEIARPAFPFGRGAPSGPFCAEARREAGAPISGALRAKPSPKAHSRRSWCRRLSQ